MASVAGAVLSLGFVSTLYLNAALGRGGFVDEGILGLVQVGGEEHLAPVVVTALTVLAATLIVECLRLLVRISGQALKVQRSTAAQVHKVLARRCGCVVLGVPAIGGNVDRLHRGDRALRRRGDALLQLAHLGGQGRLVAHRRGHAAQQRRDLGARLGEAEDVVDEEQHVLLLHVAEVLGDGQAGRAPRAGARPGGSVIWP